FFFFSSRRRHTRFSRDWSSDVCSSDLIVAGVSGLIKAFFPFVPTVVGGFEKATAAFASWGKSLGQSQGFQSFITYARENVPKLRSEERRVGKECRCRWAPDD